jgi:hypothetical protein
VEGKERERGRMVSLCVRVFLKRRGELFGGREAGRACGERLC